MHVHNNIQDEKIRKDNEAYNLTWIKENGLLFFDVVGVESFKNQSISKSDSSPYMVVWLKNIDKLMELCQGLGNISEYNLLDVGCGSGISTIYFRKKYAFKTYSGFDFEQDLIDRANMNVRNRDIPGIEFFVEDASSIRLKNEPYFLFLFHPFGLRTLEFFISNNIENLTENKSIIAYVNDIGINLFSQYDTRVIRDDYFNISIIQF